MSKDDYPMSREELLSQVMKAVSLGLGVVARPQRFSETLTVLPSQVEVQELAQEQRQKELAEAVGKMDSTPATGFSSTRVPSAGPSLGATSRIHGIPGSILTHRTNREQGPSSVSRVTFGIPSSSTGHQSSTGQATFGSTSASGGMGSSRASSAGRVTFRPGSSGSNMASTSYGDSSRGLESSGGGTVSRGAGSVSSGGPGSSRAAASSTRPASSSSKDSRCF